MKWTTSNFRNPLYNNSYVIYVGTQSGALKKIITCHETNPFLQYNLHNGKTIESHITALAYNGESRDDILIGRKNGNLELHSFYSQHIMIPLKISKPASIVSLAKLGVGIIMGLEDGRVQYLSLGDNTNINKESDECIIRSGDYMSRMRQCPTHSNIIATGGKGRINNLKVFDLALGGVQLFSSKNLPNDELQLEVPVWDNDVGFINSNHTLATCSRYGYVRIYDIRKQRRPVQCFNNKQMAFTTFALNDNYTYVGTNMGEVKCFDIRRMKSFVHTYKGFTGCITDICLDVNNKSLISISLDSYIRIHNVQNCNLMYQLYIKSKGTRLLLSDALSENLDNLHKNINVIKQECY